MVGGFVAQHLKETRITAPFGSEDFSAYSISSMITRYENGIVHLWNGINEFDTLYWFGAAPGDHWHSPGSNTEEWSMITVIDTATIEVDEVPLKQLIVETGWTTDTLLERVGFTYFYLDGWSWFLTDQPWAGLKCYRDDEITFASQDISDCDFTLAVMDTRTALEFAPHPNPGTDHFTLQLPPGLHDLTLFDAQGRLVLRQRISEERHVISTASLSSGIYHIHITDGLGRSSGQRWIKE